MESQENTGAEERENKRIPLCRGVTLHYLPERRFKSGRLSLYFLSSLGDGRQGAAALLPAVLGRGCKPYPSLRKINRALEELYDPTLDCRVSRSGEIRITSFRLSLLEGRCLPAEDLRPGKYFDEITERSFDILFSLLLEPLTRKRGEARLLRSDLLTQEKQNLLAAIRAEKNDKASYALRRCKEVLCEGEPYALNDLGAEEEILAVTARSLTTYYADLLKNQRLEIFYVGSEPSEALEGYLREKLSPLLSHRSGEQPRDTSLPTVRKAPSVEPLRHLEEQDSLSQGKLVIGCRMRGEIGKAELPAFFLYREILSSSPISKFFRYVREKEGLCYYCYASGDVIKGLLFLCAGIENDKREQAEQAILAQLDAMKKGEISQEEFACGKKSLLCALRETGDSPAAMTAWYLRDLLMDPAGATPTLTKEAVMEAVSALSVEEIADFAKNVVPEISYFLCGENESHQNDENYPTEGA